jgi:hypothetical protein
MFISRMRLIVFIGVCDGGLRRQQWNERDIVVRPKLAGQPHAHSGLHAVQHRPFCHTGDRQLAVSADDADAASRATATAAADVSVGDIVHAMLLGDAALLTEADDRHR